MQVKKGCAPSVDVAADASCRKSKDPEAEEAQESVWCLLTQRGAAEYSRTAAANIPTEAERKLHRLVQRKLRAWTRRLRAWTWPGCVDVAGIPHRRGWDLPHRRGGGTSLADQDRMRDKPI